MSETAKTVEMGKYPVCPKCHGPMVWTFAFRGHEYACLPCGEVDTFFCHNERGDFPVAEVDALKEKWRDDLHRIGMTIGGGECAKPEGTCSVCIQGKAYQFKFWKKALL